MTVAKTKKLSFEEYLAHSDDREGRWELVNGLYEAAEFRDQNRIEPAALPELQLTAADILNAGT